MQPLSGRWSALASLQLAAILLGLSGPAAAQDAAPNPQSPPPAPWTARCSAEGRNSPLDCVIEQRVVISTTGQLLAAMTVRIPPGSTQPVMLVQTPYGLYLPAGLRLSVDGVDLATLPVDTCDGSGCYAGSVVSPNLLGAMRLGNELKLVFQDVSKRDIPVPVSLLGFSAALEKIQ